MKSARDRSQPRWTLMFIGDHGKVIELKHIKWLIVGTLAILVGAVAAAVTLFAINQKLAYTNDKLRQSLETSQVRMKKVQQQTDLLMAQLALAEAKAKESRPQTAQAQTGAAAANGDGRPAETQLPQAAIAVTKPAAAEPAPKPAARPDPPISAPEPVKAVAEREPVMVEIDGLNLTRPKGSADLKLEFKLRNVSPKPQRIEGRVIAIIKGDDLPPHEWLTIPKVSLKAGLPVEKKGHRFAINNWRTMRMKASYAGGLERFNLAEIFVYATDGEVLLREVHPVTAQ